jgi:hypothetical protein
LIRQVVPFAKVFQFQGNHMVKVLSERIRPVLIILLVSLVPVFVLAGPAAEASADTGGLPDEDPNRWQGQLQFFSSNLDSFMVALGDSVIPAGNGSIFTYDQPYMMCTIIARGYRDKQISFFPLRDSLRVLRFEMEAAGPGEAAGSIYPVVHWRANVILTAEPGTRFELDGNPVRDLTDVHTEFLNDHTVLLRLRSGHYRMKAHYADGSSREELVRTTHSRLVHAQMYQRPLRHELRSARWVPGGGQSLRHQRARANLIRGAMITSALGTVLATMSYDARRDRFDESYQKYLDAPERADLDALYRDARREQDRANLMAGLGVASALTFAGTYLFNVIDGGRGYREYIGIDPYVDFDAYTGHPAVGFRYRFD